MNRNARATATTATGTLRKKIQGQSKKVTMNPPNAGPITGATRPGVVEMAMTLTNSLLGVLRSSTRFPTGAIRVAARACTTRAATNSGRPWLRPQSTDDRAKAMMAPTNTRRAPSRSATQVETGRKAAITRM